MSKFSSQQLACIEDGFPPYCYLWKRTLLDEYLVSRFFTKLGDDLWPPVTDSQSDLLRDNHCNAAEVLCLGSYSKDISSVLVLLDYGYDFKVQTEN
jgi:hypothetical protein